MGQFSANTRGRAFMATIHETNMCSMGLEEAQYKQPEFLAGYLTTLWNSSGKDRTSAVAVCESADGCYHAHMAVYGNTTTLKTVSKILHNSHVEPQLGGKKELAAYLRKEGNYAEKGERVLYTKNIEAVQDTQGSRSDLEAIEELLLKGYTPNEILERNFRYYRYETMILRAYRDKRIQETPIRKQLYFEYHVGETGSGKTFFYNHLCEQYGPDQIYLLTDFDNNASGGLDNYMREGAPPILFIDEFKGEGISYQKLLVMLNEFTRMQTHSRYANTYNLWEKVYMTTIYPPEELYEIMVPEGKRNTDTYGQLLRRMNKLVYHYKEGNEFKSYAMERSQYINYTDLKAKAFAIPEGFAPLTAEEQAAMPFEEEPPKKGGMEDARDSSLGKIQSDD